MKRRPGYVLIAVLIVTVVLTLVAYRFTDSMSAQITLAARNTEAAQAKAHAISGVHYAAALLADRDSYVNKLKSNPFDNAEYFSNVQVQGSVARGGGRFALFNIIDDAGGDGAGKYRQRFGVTCEGGKINLNAMMRIDSSGESLYTMLMLLPNMTEEIADAIIDWIDEDTDPRPNGTETYEGYTGKNGPLSTLDELLLVPGVTPYLLFGTDYNRNGVEDPGESDPNGFNRGWSDFLTVYGHELNIDSTGQPRININGTIDATVHKQLTEALGSEMADYLVAYRLYGGSSSLTPLTGTAKTGSAADLNAAVVNSLNTGAAAKTKIKNSTTSLYNTRVRLPAAPGSPPNTPAVYINSPLNNRDVFNQMLPTLLDKVTTKSSYELNPRININTAQQDLLMVLPGLTPEDVAAAISARATVEPGSPEYVTGAWMVTKAGQRPEVFQQIERFITGQSMVYRVQSLGYFANGGPVSRVEAVVDTNNGYPRILYFRDLTDLGGGFEPPR